MLNYSRRNPGWHIGSETAPAAEGSLLPSLPSQLTRLCFSSQRLLQQRSCSNVYIAGYIHVSVRLVKQNCTPIWENPQCVNCKRNYFLFLKSIMLFFNSFQNLLVAGSVISLDLGLSELCETFQQGTTHHLELVIIDLLTYYLVSLLIVVWPLTGSWTRA